MRRGNQFLLPTEDSIGVSAELAGATACRNGSTPRRRPGEHRGDPRGPGLTGRDLVLMFDGKYHGHFDDALVELDASGRLVPEEAGLPRRHAHTRLVPFNEPGAGGAEARDMAIVLTEPALTNNHGPAADEGFHGALRG